MHTKLYFVRHGQTYWNKEGRLQGQIDAELNETGISQAHSLSAELKDIVFSNVFSSPLQRALHTAKIVAPDTRIELSDALKEINLGPFEGISKKEAAEGPFKEQYHYLWNEPHLFHLDGAETFAEIQQRGLSFVQSFMAEHVKADEQQSEKRISAKPVQQKNILLLSHGALIQTIFAHFQNIPIEDLWKQGGMNNCDFRVLEFEDGQYSKVSAL